MSLAEVTRKGYIGRGPRPRGPCRYTRISKLRTLFIPYRIYSINIIWRGMTTEGNLIAISQISFTQQRKQFQVWMTSCKSEEAVKIGYSKTRLHLLNQIRNGETESWLSASEMKGGNKG